MDRVGRGRAVAPLAIIVLFATLDIVAGPERVVLGLVVIAPLLAASILGWRATVSYGVLALVVAGLLGIYDGQYTPQAWPGQAVRLFGVALGGVLAVGACRSRLEREAWSQRLTRDAAEAQAHARDAERVARLAETLQRSLLRDPPPLEQVEIAVRYLPAAEHVKVGGDWYDAFPVPGGRTVLVIGDVAGHDGAAAATMAQVRNLLRGIAQVVVEPPAVVLGALDRALRDLSVGALATMVLVEIEDERTGGGGLILRWSNAGHPPPLLVCGDGAIHFLEREPDLLLGVDPDARRVDHVLELAAGETVVLFTDGLVERRGSSIDEGLRWVRDTAAAVGRLPLEELCDVLLSRFPDRAEDDVAVLALRARPRDGAARTRR